MTWRRSTAWEALGVAPAHPSEHGAAMSRVTSGIAGASPPCASSWAQGLAAARPASRSAVTETWVRRPARGVSSTPARATPEWSARGTAQRTIVPCCQTSRWRQVRSRESRAPRGAPHTGRGTAAPRLRATPACSLSAPSCGSNQTSATSQASPRPIDLSRSLAGTPPARASVSAPPVGLTCVPISYRSRDSAQSGPGCASHHKCRRASFFPLRPFLATGAFSDR